MPLPTWLTAPAPDPVSPEYMRMLTALADGGQTGAAELLRIDRSTVVRWLSGTHPCPWASAELLRQILAGSVQAQLYRVPQPGAATAPYRSGTLDDCRTFCGGLMPGEDVLILHAGRLSRVSRPYPAGPEPLAVSEQDAETMLGLAPDTLGTWRRQGRQTPPAVRMGRRVVYPMQKLKDWLAHGAPHGDEPRTKSKKTADREEKTR